MAACEWKVVRPKGRSRRPDAKQDVLRCPCAEPVIRRTATLTCLRGADGVDVLTPACSVRQIRCPLPDAVDLSLPRSLARLQAEDGGFDLSPDFVAVLGLRDPVAVTEAKASADSRLIGALLMLKTALIYGGESWELSLERICKRAVAYSCRCLSVSKRQLWALLEQVEDCAVDVSALPCRAVALLRGNFGARVLWSQCDLWVPLLMPATKCRLHHAGGVLCPRNFLVDLATASRCPHALHSQYLLYRRSGRLYVGTLAVDHITHDAMRQGRQLEAGVVSFGWLEEDRLLMEMTLPNGLFACYAGAPDALAEYSEVAATPLVAGDESAYRAAGYKLKEDTQGASKGTPRVQFWHASGGSAGASSGAYVEVKKTTKLKGSNGEYKRSKYWMQAALAGCAGVLIATTEHSEDHTTASVFERLSLDDLASTVIDPTAMWLDLAMRLEHIMAATSGQEGAWTLTLRKAPAVDMEVHRGWSADETLHDMEHIFRTEEALSESHEVRDEFDEMGHWEMESGNHWTFWKPEGLNVIGSPGQVVHFKVNGSDYCAVFGSGDGYQENLITGRRRKLRYVNANAGLAAEADVDTVQQLCAMGFSHSEVMRVLRVVGGNSARAVEYLLGGVGA
mmetsp:Transcript_124758/g.216319  ORF Transcript_124758/g.216319 Transcript_124758/m.216319 type:complete len:622 (-) Transcript_124758:190-2055(-)